MCFDLPKYSHKLSKSVVLNCDVVRKYGSAEQNIGSYFTFVLRHQKVKKSLKVYVILSTKYKSPKQILP